MEKCFLTNGGNLLRFHPSEKFYFQKPNGEFIREVSSEEAEYLSQNCLEIEVNNPSKHPEFLPTWHFVKSVRVLDDYSNYRWETCTNGGDYSFHVYHDWFVAKYPDGSWKFAFVERHFTSAEFSYDELAGSFQSDMGYLCLSNVADRREYNSQKGIEWKDGEKFYTSSEVLEKIGNIANFSDLWNEEYLYIPSRWDDEDKEYTRPALTFSDRKQIVERLKELYTLLGGYEVKTKSSRGNRGDKKRR